MIKGISHLTFIVEDLDRAETFFRSIFDAEVVYASGERQFSISEERFLMIGQIWIAIMKGSPLKEQTYNHIAWDVADEHFDDYANKVRSLGVKVLPERSRISGEGRSIYFYDYDNHLFEIHSGSLSRRLRSYAQQGKSS